MIKLFKHNREAYESAVAMLETVGKACVIHPTGTGKSFIGFKLCEDNPDKTILWLSPSEYIFKTQLENLAKVSDGYVPENIVFMTYSKLMLLSEKDISELKPSYIVIDEMHRTGAECWGAGVDLLLKTYPNVPILGLTATAIRYLDNQRNMADELFDGHIASEMTLGEAIVKGILSPPKYVLSIFSYQNDLKKYEKRIAYVKNKKIREKAESYLEALRRSLEKAEGLDVIFDKHITDRTGKYLVFTPNFETMQEYIVQSKEWFSKIDDQPHIYSVYSEDPTASRSFEEFKKDDSEHLKLLFCIDALNEGVHVEDVSGVILMRPTVSPIIYKQQIGRALSAAKKNSPVIFDIVNNIGNLYSVDALKEEMEFAISYLRSVDGERLIVNDTFEVIDELKDCFELFDSLENTLTVTWDVMFEEAKRYYEENGDLLVQQKYITENGLGLGSWICTQRKLKRSDPCGLTEEKIIKLESVGMCWETMHERFWRETYEIVKAYYEKNHTLENIDKYSERANDWIIRQRQKYRTNLLDKEQIELLNNVGMIWDYTEFKNELWNRYYELAKEYYEKNGDLDIPATYITEDGMKLGRWYRSMKGLYRNEAMSDECLKKLQAIGFQTESILSRRWKIGYEYAVQYYNEHNDLAVPLDYTTDEGFRLGKWISGQRDRYVKGFVLPEQKELLDKIGMSWDRFDTKWERGFQYALRYINEHGDINKIPSGFKYDDFNLLSWVRMQRQRDKEGKLSPERKRRLEDIGLRWTINSDAWNNGFEHAKEYFSVNGDLDIPANYVSSDGFKLSVWLLNQRTKKRTGKLSSEQVELLESIGMIWKLYDHNWEQGFREAEIYYKKFNDLNINKNYRTGRSPEVFYWVNSQRKLYRDGKLSEEQISRLESIGMDWLSPYERAWENGFKKVESYVERNNTASIPVTYRNENGEMIGLWLRHQVERKDKLTNEQVNRLQSLGVAI